MLKKKHDGYIKIRKTRGIIESMERQCSDNLTFNKCAGVSCKNCALNQKYKHFVGIGMEEVY